MWVIQGQRWVQSSCPVLGTTICSGEGESGSLTPPFVGALTPGHRLMLSLYCGCSSFSYHWMFCCPAPWNRKKTVGRSIRAALFVWGEKMRRSEIEKKGPGQQQVIQVCSESLIPQWHRGTWMARPDHLSGVGPHQRAAGLGWGSAILAVSLSSAAAFRLAWVARAEPGIKMLLLVACK